MKSFDKIDKYMYILTYINACVYLFHLIIMLGERCDQKVIYIYIYRWVSFGKLMSYDITCKLLRFQSSIALIFASLFPPSALL